ncbi:serine hydrolase domain-containing protein [Halogeometricum luteum]|uniref:Beta-lactamase family protein n=1 Tax=Halogeometricum luteum TaxID=2950537 RepID=A0ABU2G5A2_9EURY|nr:serine hydrolase domain-containing protein [Halogeometricum sp. S3BR5-2]MDS0295328.1 beta-lactamase family protein [Halogeometricum sp. S3BR5-2]
MPNPQTVTETVAGDDCHNAYSRRTVLRGLAATGAAAFAFKNASGSVSATTSSQQDQATGPLSDPESFETFLDGVVDAQLEAHDIPGATVAVVDDDATFTKGYGLRDVRTDAPVDANRTLFRIGSTSKLFTWTAVMQGIEAGRLDVDTDVNEYLDAVEVPDKYDQPITLDHLATHTAGFEDRARGTFVLNESDLRPLPTMLQTEQPARVRPPGTFTAYSNYGAALAGYIAASTAGSSFGEYVDEHIFGPLQMKQSTFDQPVPDAIDGVLSNGYTTSNGRYREGEFEYVGMPPAGSMTTTAIDMARFLRAHLQGGATSDGRILEADSTEMMHRRRFGNAERLNGMCFGFYELSRNDVRIVGHGGDTDQFHSLVALLPDHSVGLFVSYNSPGGIEARDELLDALVEEYYLSEEKPPLTPNGEPARANELSGTYRALRSPYTTSEKLLSVQSTVSVSLDEQGRLVTTDPREPTRWVEVEERYFEAVDGSDALVFGETDGEITHLFFDSRPPSAYERLTVVEQPSTHAVIAGLSILVFLGAVLGWTATWLWRWFRGGRRDRPDSPLRYTHHVAGLAAVSYLVFVVGMSALIVSDPRAALLGGPQPLQVILLFALVGAVSSAATLVLAGLTWRRGLWRRRRQAQYVVVGLSGVVFALVLSYWNLLWYQM